MREGFVSRRGEVYRDILSTNFDEYKKSLPKDEQQNKYLWERFLLACEDDGSVWFYELMVDNLDLLENKMDSGDVSNDLVVITSGIRQRCDLMTKVEVDKKTGETHKFRVLSPPMRDIVAE